MDDSGLQLNGENRYDDDNDDLLPTQIVDDRVLKGVTAYVEVRSANDNRSEAVKQVLKQLGATVEDKFTNDVTHVIFKEGSTRTKNKAKKKGIHLLSVLWVENCKLNQEHVSERMYPANVPEVSDKPFMKTKLKKLKSMQPKDFEEELANSAKRVARKRKKENMMNNLRGGDCTPSNSPYLGTILVQDTQPHSQEDGLVFTPIRLTIPETPPSMREKMKQLKLKKAERESLYSNSEVEDEIDQREWNFKQLQKKLFNGVNLSDDGDMSSSYQSPSDISSILSAAADNDDDDDNGDDVDDDNGDDDDNDHADLPTHQSESSIQKQTVDEFNSSIRSESSVNNDVLAIAKNINATLNSPSKRFSVFGMDSDENLASSQEIKACANVTVKVSRKTGKISNSEDQQVVNAVKGDDSRNSDLDISASKSNEKKNISDALRKKTRRSSRRLSVKQALDALDESNLLGLVPETIDEEEDPIPKSSKIHTDLSTTDTSCDKSMDLSDSSRIDKNSKKGGQRSRSNKRTSSLANESNSVNPEEQEGIGKTNGRKQRKKANSERKGSVRKKSLPETDAKDKSEIDIEQKHSDGNEIDKVVTKNSKGRNSRKKKLLSINDMYEQSSVLIEPSTCSQMDRPELIEESTVKTSKRGRKRQSPRLKKSVINDTVDEINTGKASKSDNKNVEGKTRGRKRKSMETSETDNVNDITESKSRGRGSRRTKIQKTLVNDTHIENTTLGATSADPNCSVPPVAKIQDVTTQLNLTKDNSLVCSIRETTLSLSMSAAYNDSNMPSFLTSQRKSIDEFNASKRHRKNSKLTEKSVLASIGESLSSDNKRSDSEASVMDESCNKRMKSFRSGKLCRPSIVMTSLHSCEQDVVISVVKKLGGFVIAENVNETTTHVICGEPRRTLNVIRCMARGAWLLSKDWVITSLEKGEWIEEHEYECTSCFPSCKIARLERERCKGLYRQSIFRNVGPMYVSGKSRPSRPHLVQLIKLCGGQVIGVKEKASVYIGSDYHPGLTCVKTTWLLDCITEHVVKPMEEYFLDRPKRESSPEF
ncbi:BRCA1 associated RING domain 1 [Mactra antiquata]